MSNFNNISAIVKTTITKADTDKATVNCRYSENGNIKYSIDIHFKPKNNENRHDIGAQAMVALRHLVDCINNERRKHPLKVEKCKNLDKQIQKLYNLRNRKVPSSFTTTEKTVKVNKVCNKRHYNLRKKCLQRQNKCC